MSPFVLVYSIAMLVFFILFIVDAIRLRAEVGKYARAGVWLGIIALLIDLTLLVFATDPSALDETTCITVVIVDVLLVVKLALFAGVGLYCGVAMGHPSAPLVLDLFGPATRAPASSEQSPADSRGEYSVHEIDLHAEPIEHASTDQTERPDWRMGLAWVLVVTGVSVAYSCLLLGWTEPQLSVMLQEALEISEAGLAQHGVAVNPTLQAILVVCAFAYGEEIIFRLGIQNLLAKNLKLHGSRYWVAIIITAGFWSLAHANTLDPEWVKFVQIFPIGLAMGWLFRKYGVEMCILAHGAFNIVMVFLGPNVIEM